MSSGGDHQGSLYIRKPIWQAVDPRLFVSAEYWHSEMRRRPILGGHEIIAERGRLGRFERKENAGSGIFYATVSYHLRLKVGFSCYRASFVRSDRVVEDWFFHAAYVT